jgi:hypothetical protein
MLADTIADQRLSSELPVPLTAARAGERKNVLKVSRQCIVVSRTRDTCHWAFISILRSRHHQCCPQRRCSFPSPEPADPTVSAPLPHIECVVSAVAKDKVDQRIARAIDRRCAVRARFSTVTKRIGRRTQHEVLPAPALRLPHPSHVHIRKLSFPVPAYHSVHARATIQDIAADCRLACY